MRLAIVGCGYVSAFYGETLGAHSDLALAGVYDQQPERMRAFASRWPCRQYATLDELLADPAVELVVNLTNPRSHAAITRAALEAGKHVYSEKPLAMTTDEAAALARLAEARGLILSSAPCSVLGETAQTLWKAVRDGVVGRVRVVYANFDDGMIAPHGRPWLWTSATGAPWPAKDEFEVGCTYQHAGYVLTWLTAMFGPVRRVTAFASVQVPDKGIPVDRMAPDFTIGGLEFDGGVAARVTCGLVAPRDKSLTVVGDDGLLFVGTVRNDTAPVMWRAHGRRSATGTALARVPALRRWLDARLPEAALDLLQAEALPLLHGPRRAVAHASKPVDFCRGPADLAAAVAAGRPPRLTAAMGVHLVELVERLQYPERFADDARVRTTFAPVPPMPWAE